MKTGAEGQEKPAIRKSIERETNNPIITLKIVKGIPNQKITLKNI